jgi:hypothetical protein
VVVKGLTIIRINNKQTLARDRWEWRKIVLEGKVDTGMYCLRRGEGEEEKKNN